MRTYLPWILSIGMVLGLAATALAAGQIGPFNKYNKDRYWDSPVWINQSGDTFAKIKVKCRDESDSNDPNDWIKLRMWRHAGIFPPYSVGTKTISTCRNSQKSKTWSSNMGGPESFHFQIRGFSFNGGYDGDRRIDMIPYRVNWD